MKKYFLLLGLTIILSGCGVSKSDHETLQKQLDSSNETISSLTTELNECKSAADNVESELSLYKPSTTVDTSKGFLQTEQLAIDTITDFLEQTNSCINGNIDRLYVYFNDDNTVQAASCYITTKEGCEYPAFISCLDDNIIMVTIRINSELEYTWMDNMIQSGWSLSN